jgi:hypothetical protein
VFARIVLSRAAGQVSAPISANPTQLLQFQSGPAERVSEQLSHPDEFARGQRQWLDQAVLDHSAPGAAGRALTPDDEPALFQGHDVWARRIDVDSGRVGELAQRSGAMLVKVSDDAQADWVGNGFEHGC